MITILASVSHTTENWFYSHDILAVQSRVLIGEGGIFALERLHVKKQRVLQLMKSYSRSSDSHNIHYYMASSAR